MELERVWCCKGVSWLVQTDSPCALYMAVLPSCSHIWELKRN